MLSRAGWHKPDRTKECILCGESKPLGEFYAYGYTTKQGKPSTRYESRCRPCSQERRRNDYDPEQGARQRRAWRSRNLDRIADYNRERQKSPEVKALKAYNQRLRKARMRANADDNDAIRAIYLEAMEVEKIVSKCPVFDLPELGKRMQVDHIVPLSKGGKHIPSNLQILPIGINMRKGVVSW